MRFFETLLVVFAAIYVAQLLIAVLLVATALMFLWCVYARPREALVLGLGVLLIAFVTKPIGFALLLAIAAGYGLWSLFSALRACAKRRIRNTHMLPRR